MTMQRTKLAKKWKCCFHRVPRAEYRALQSACTSQNLVFFALKFFMWFMCAVVPASVAQLAKTVRTDRDGLSEEPGFNSPGRPVDFVFGFQGRML